MWRSSAGVASLLRAGSPLAALGRGLADVIYPPACPACGRRVFEPGGVCARCWGRLRFISRPYCDVLGTPFSFDLGEGAVSAEAIAAPPDFRRARAAVMFDTVARNLVHALKYQDRDVPVRFMSAAMVRAGRELFTENALLAPVPLHRKRLWQRRFNQSQLLAASVARKAGLENDPSVLERIRPTRQQVGLTDLQRQKNVRGAFRVPDGVAGRIAERPVILVDDVVTTGATVNACARALKRAGAASVDVLVFARVADQDSVNI